MALTVIYSNQTAYVNKWCISEVNGWSLILLKFAKKQNIAGYLVAMDIETAFDSLDHDFLVTVLNKFGFRSNFMSWIKLLFNIHFVLIIEVVLLHTLT